MKIERTIRIEKTDVIFRALLRQLLDGPGAGFIDFFDRKKLMDFYDPIKTFDSVAIAQSIGVCDKVARDLKQIIETNKRQGATLANPSLQGVVGGLDKLHLYFVEMRNLIAMEENDVTNSAGE